MSLGEPSMTTSVATKKQNGDADNDNLRRNIDEIFVEMGPRTKFYYVHLIFTIYIILTMGYLTVIPYFTGMESGWKCVNNNSSSFCRHNHNRTINVNSIYFFARCKLGRSEWTYNAPKESSFVTEFDLICKKRGMAALVSASYFIGALIGSLISGLISDNFGRKPLILATLPLVTLSSILGGYVTNPWQLIGLNTVIGAAGGSSGLLILVYHMEFVPPKTRAISMGFLQLSHVASCLLLDVAAYYERNWRKLKIYASLPCLLGFFVLMILPESPRWLLSKGKMDKVMSIMNKIAQFNACSVDLSRLKCPNASDKKLYTSIDLLRSRKVLILTLSISLGWFASNYIAYLLTLGSNHLGGNPYRTLAFAVIASIPGLLIAPFLSNRFGRKISALGCLLLCGILVGSMALVPKTMSARYYINIALLVTTKITIVATAIGMFIWAFELFPTQLRSQGMFLCVIAERIGIILVPFAWRVLFKISFALPYAIAFAIAILTSLFGLVLPETSNKPTRETYEDFFTSSQDRSSRSIENAAIDIHEEENVI